MHTRRTSPVAMSRTTPLSSWHRGQTTQAGRLPPGMVHGEEPPDARQVFHASILQRHNPEVRPLCGNKQARSVKLHTTPKNLLELWRTRQEINLATRHLTPHDSKERTRHSMECMLATRTTNLSRSDNFVLHKTHSSSSAKLASDWIASQLGHRMAHSR